MSDKYVTQKHLRPKDVAKYITPNSGIDHLLVRKTPNRTKTPNRHGQNMSMALQQTRT